MELRDCVDLQRGLGVASVAAVSIWAGHLLRHPAAKPVSVEIALGLPVLTVLQDPFYVPLNHRSSLIELLGCNFRHRIGR